MRRSTDEHTELIPLATEESRLGDEVQSLRRELDKRTRDLAQSEARFRDVIERNADAIVVVDETGVVRFVNRAATLLFDASREELLGSSFGFPLVTGETTELDLPRNGDPRVAEMRVVESEWEGLAACIASLRDVTDRKHAEQDARELIREHAARAAAEDAARRLQFLLESSTVLGSSLDYAATLSAVARLCVAKLADWVVVYGVDDRGGVRRLDLAHRDPAKAHLVADLEPAPIDEHTAHPVVDVLNTGRSVLVKTAGDEVLQALTQNARQLELIRQLGAASFMIVPIVALDRPLGAIALVSADPQKHFDEQDLALAEDIAARAALAVANARLYDEARKANKLKSDFLAVLSHDLRTPLTGIIGYVDLMDMGVPDPLPDATRQRLQRVRTAATHLLYLLNELLGFARLDAGREELRLEETDLCEIARQAAAVAEPLAHERGLRLVLDLPDYPVVLRTDGDKVRQVLLNLVGNAVKYTQAGDVSVELRSLDNQRAVIRVRDTGIGVSEQHLQQIFEPFWQVNATARTAEGGTGLGLSVVRRLVELLGGEVSVASQVGKGSTFTVSLPAR